MNFFVEMARPGNLICINRLINTSCQSNISSCRLSTFLKGTDSHVERVKGNKRSVTLLRPHVFRGLSSFNVSALGLQGRLVHFSGREKKKIKATLSDCYLTTGLLRSQNVRFISSSSQNNRPASYSRFKLSDVVNTQYGIPATMKEVALSEQVINSVSYEDENLIAINKPYGTHVFGQTIPGKEDELGYCIPIDPNLPVQPYACIADIMPILRRHFNCPNLQIVHSIKMFYTGVVIMAKNSKVKDDVIQAIDRSKSPGLPYQTYLAVTYGIPKIEGVKESTIHLIQKKHQGELLSFTSRFKSKTKRKDGQVQKVNISCSIIKRNNTLNCALVRFDTSKDKWHSTEVFATEQLCSILGDYRYSSRVIKIADVPVKVEPHGAEVGKQKLPPFLKKALGLKSGKQMPLHLHRAKVDLRNFQKKSTLSILAPFPNYFATTLKNLGLHLPFEEIFKDDCQNG